MKRAPLLVPILTMVLFLLPILTEAWDEEILLSPNSGSGIRVVAYAGEILEVQVIVTSARHVNTGEENEYIGIDFDILQYGVPIFSMTNVRTHTWSTSADEDVTLEARLTNLHSNYEFVVQFSTETSLIRDVILIDTMMLSAIIVLGVIVWWGIRRSQWWKYRAVTITEAIQSPGY